MKGTKGISCQRDPMTFTLNLVQVQTLGKRIDFQKEVECLPFQFNMVDVPLKEKKKDCSN